MLAFKKFAIQYGTFVYNLSSIAVQPNKNSFYSHFAANSNNFYSLLSSVAKA